MAWLPVALAQNETNPLLTFAPEAILTATSAVAATNPETFEATGPTHTSSSTAAGVPENPAPGNKPLPVDLRLTPWTAEIVKLAESGIEDDVMLSFIDNSGTFNLGADQIIYLSDLGVSGQIISEMLQHDREVISGTRPVTITSALATQTLIPASWKASNGASNKTKTEPARTPAPSEESLALEHRSDTTTQPAVVQCAMLSEGERAMQSVSDQPSQSSGRKNELYRVRAPNPVELLPPIVFMNEAQPPANTIIILGFPRDTP